jgi:hypothetical protein
VVWEKGWGWGPYLQVLEVLALFVGDRAGDAALDDGRVNLLLQFGVGVSGGCKMEHRAADGRSGGVGAGDQLEGHLDLALALRDAVADEGAEHVLLVFGVGAEALSDDLLCNPGDGC